MPNSICLNIGVLKQVEDTLNVLADSVLHEQPPVRRRKLEHLITELVHQRDTTRLLIRVGFCLLKNFKIILFFICLDWLLYRVIIYINIYYRTESRIHKTSPGSCRCDFTTIRDRPTSCSSSPFIWRMLASSMVLNTLGSKTNWFKHH